MGNSWPWVFHYREHLTFQASDMEKFMLTSCCGNSLFVRDVINKNMISGPFNIRPYLVWNTVQPAYKVVQIQGMSAYSVRSAGPDSCACIGIGIGKSRLIGFSGYSGGLKPFHISGLICTCRNHLQKLANSNKTTKSAISMQILNFTQHTP